MDQVGKVHSAYLTFSYGEKARNKEGKGPQETFCFKNLFQILVSGNRWPSSNYWSMLAQEHLILYHNRSILYNVSTLGALKTAQANKESSDTLGEKLQQHIKDNFLQVYFQNIFR